MKTRRSGETSDREQATMQPEEPKSQSDDPLDLPLNTLVYKRKRKEVNSEQPQPEQPTPETELQPQPLETETDQPQPIPEQLQPVQVQPNTEPSKRKKRAVMKRPKKKAQPSLVSPELSTDLGFQCRDGAHKARYEITLKRKLLPTRFLCADSLKRLGIFDDMREMLQRVGVFDFVQRGKPTKRELTVEFFSSVVFNDGVLHFRLGSKDHELDATEFRKVFDLPAYSNAPAPWGASYQIKDFWGLMSEHPYTNVANAHASQIFPLCFRYSLRLMAYTVFMRGDCAQKVRNPELELLYAMVYNKGNSLDIATTMMKELASVGSRGGEISAGGIVTLIADYLTTKEANLISYPTTDVDNGSYLLDLRCLANMKIIRTDGPKFYLLDEGTRVKLYLPDPDRTKFSATEFWRPSKISNNAGASSAAPTTSNVSAPAQPQGAPAQPTSAPVTTHSAPASDQRPQTCPTCGLAPTSTEMLVEILSMLRGRSDNEAHMRSLIEDRLKMIDEMYKWWQENRRHFQPPPQ